MEDERLLRARDVAHILDCSPDDVYPLISTGALKASKVGRLWKFRLEDVISYKKRRNGDGDRQETPRKVNSRRQVLSDLS
jgi:excisionase family DNA binding protein